MATWNITSKNRGAAKRILNSWHDSREVRLWSLDRIGNELQRAVRNGLITDEGIARALGATLAPQYNAPPAKSSQSNDSDSNNGDDNADGASAADNQSQSSQSNADDSDDTPASSADSNMQVDDSDDDSDSADGKSDDSDSASGDDASTDGDDCAAPDDDNTTDDDADLDDDSPTRHAMYNTVLKYIKAGLNVALVGPAGTGKSTIALQVAEETGREFRGCGAIMSRYDLVGFVDAHGTYHESPLYQAYTDGHLFCFDELDASAPEGVVAFNAITDTQPVYAFPNGMQSKHSNFVAIACMNTFGNGASAAYVGRFKQDAASMDRFVRVFIDYDRKIEARIGSKKACTRAWEVRDACSKLGIQHIVSTRMIIKTDRAIAAGLTLAEIDRDIIFSGLDDGAVRQIKAAITAARKGN